MIFNIQDERSRPLRWKRINAIIEATAHDNGLSDSDQVVSGSDDVTYDQREGISLQEAIAWADSQPSAVTLFIYDEGDGL